MSSFTTAANIHSNKKADANTSREPLCLLTNARPTLHPIRVPDVFALYKELEASTWTAEEVDMSGDHRDFYKKMSAADRMYYKYVLAMFAFADEKILDNLGDRFIQEITMVEAKYVYRMQAAQEQVHSESYSKIIVALFKDDEVQAIFDAVTTMPVIKSMSEWATRWIDSSKTIGERMLAFAVFEGVMFQSQFMAIQLLKSRNLLSGVTMYNQLIARDEYKHFQIACHFLNNHIEARPSPKVCHTIMKQAVNLVVSFQNEAISEAKKAAGLPGDADCPVHGVTLSKMEAYTQAIADHACVKMGYSMIYNTENPYPEHTNLALNMFSKTNFFEETVTQYNTNVDYDGNDVSTDGRAHSVAHPGWASGVVLSVCRANAHGGG
jgi:ribonucleotide reductase beta subunit family protein with ferritin-like domain